MMIKMKNTMMVSFTSFSDSTSTQEPTICIAVSEYEQLKALQDSKGSQEKPIASVKGSMRQKQIKRSDAIFDDDGSSEKLSKIKTSFRNYFRLSDTANRQSEINAFFGHNLLSVRKF